MYEPEDDKPFNWKECLNQLFTEASWYQKAALNMILAHFEKDKNAIPLTKDDIQSIAEILVVLRKMENDFVDSEGTTLPQTIFIGGALRLLHQLDIRLSKHLELNELKTSPLPDIILACAIVGAKLDHENAVFNDDFSTNFISKFYNPQNNTYHLIKTINRIEKDHLAACNYQLELPINRTERVFHIATLLKYVPKEDLEFMMEAQLPLYQHQNLLKIAQAILDICNLDLAKAVPNRHRQFHHPKKNEIKTSDDFNIDYRNFKKSGK